jgi:hypothetical protein
VYHVLGGAAVCDKADAVDRDGRFCDICRQDALAHPWRRAVKNLVLLVDGQGGVQGQDDPALALDCVFLNGLRNVKRSDFNFDIVGSADVMLLTTEYVAKKNQLINCEGNPACG